MAIQDVVEHAQAAILTAVTALKAAPNYPSDLRIGEPTVIAYADNMAFRLESAAMYHTWFDLKVDMMIPRGDVTASFKWLAGVPALIANVFRADPTIGGHAQSYEGDITANFASGPINGVDCIGYRILIKRVKLSE
jgi:hypothetical protein